MIEPIIWALSIALIAYGVWELLTLIYSKFFG